MTTLQLTKTGIKPDQVAQLDAVLAPLLADLVRETCKVMPPDRQDSLTDGERVTLMSFLVIAYLLERAEHVGGPAYQHLLDELGGEVWARSLEVVAGVVESQMAKRAGREQ